MHQNGLSGLHWGVQLQLPARGSASNPRDSLGSLPDGKGWGPGTAGGICFAVHTELKLQGTT